MDTQEQDLACGTSRIGYVAAHAAPIASLRGLHSSLTNSEYQIFEILLMRTDVTTKPDD